MVLLPEVRTKDFYCRWFPTCCVECVECTTGSRSTTPFSRCSSSASESELASVAALICCITVNPMKDVWTVLRVPVIGIQMKDTGHTMLRVESQRKGQLGPKKSRRRVHVNPKWDWAQRLHAEPMVGLTRLTRPNSRIELTDPLTGYNPG